MGGTRPTSQPPVRTNSSQFPTPAALTSISTCPVSNGGGSGSSRSATSSPNASMPTALKLMRGLSPNLHHPGWRRRRPRDNDTAAAALVERALRAQEPPLQLPPDAAAQEALVAELDASGDEADFRRARAAASRHFLHESSYEDA